MYSPSFTPLLKPSSTMASTRNPLKTRLKRGETLYGIFLMTFSPTLAEIACLAGYDFVVIDMEHCHGGISDRLPCLHALVATLALLRLPETVPLGPRKPSIWAQRPHAPYDQRPGIHKESLVFWPIPSVGIGGAAHPVIRASKYGLDEDYVVNCDRDLFIMCEVETNDAVGKVGVIAAVEGVTV